MNKLIDDEHMYTRMMETLVKLNLKPKEKIMILNLMKYREEHKTLTGPQQSVLASIFYDYAA